MENTNDALKPKLPGGLNVLTILTFVGCALYLLAVGFGFLTAQKNYEAMDETIAQMDKAPAFLRSMMGTPEEYKEMITKSYETRIPMLLLGLAAIGLCFFGALQMRKLKKQGYMLYVIGEILPFITQTIFLGTALLTSGGTIFFMCIAILFILLYTAQRKHLVN